MPLKPVPEKARNRRRQTAIFRSRFQLGFETLCNGRPDSGFVSRRFTENRLPDTDILTAFTIIQERVDLDDHLTDNLTILSIQRLGLGVGRFRLNRG
ncbi:hypothetical protein MSNKSG1_05566 [Marinobacter santoriniensis NKSG1]|uniref:Uncharacterized protein n=1 Tax=Marinobacter santoriniensis NKSG1 TaxID=1288826 RepID=M7DGI0_9GAMM|nr:hypothetical protein MSNKSG1_05566 [Marinobacter santoriniensis NKSG1]